MRASTIAMLVMTIVACSSGDDEVVVEPDPNEACAGTDADTILVDYPESFYNTAPLSLIRFAGRLWVTARGVNNDDRGWQPGFWAPLDCTGAEPPDWSFSNPEGMGSVQLIAGEDRLLLGTALREEVELTLLDAQAEPLGPTTRVESRMGGVPTWGRTQQGFFMPELHLREGQSLGLLTLDEEAAPVEQVTIDIVIQRSDLRVVGPPDAPKVVAFDPEAGNLAWIGLDGSRSEVDVPRQFVGVGPTDPLSPWLIWASWETETVTITDGVVQRELDLRRPVRPPVLAAEGSGFWIAMGKDVFWLSSLDAEPKGIGATDQVGFMASHATSIGEGRVAVLFHDYGDGGQPIVQIFER